MHAAAGAIPGGFPRILEAGAVFLFWLGVVGLEAGKVSVAVFRDGGVDGLFNPAQPGAEKLGFEGAGENRTDLFFVFSSSRFYFHEPRE